MFGIWLQQLQTAGFVLLLFLGVMWALRHRFGGKYAFTLGADVVAVIACYALAVDTAFAGLAFVMFQLMFYGFYPGVMFLLLGWTLHIGGVHQGNLWPATAAMVVGLLLHFWHKEWELRIAQRDQFAKKNHQLQDSKAQLTTALAQVEQMSILTERSRISGEIHDNAGHEIVAAFISLQTVRKIMEQNPAKALELFDKSMARLNTGVGKMRDAVHNMQPVRQLGVPRLAEICQNYPSPQVKFTAFGDATNVTASMWAVLEAVLNESLTNVTRHAQASYIAVELDSTDYLVRLHIENDGVQPTAKATGSGLRNLQNRVATVGGNLTTQGGSCFTVVCVIPI